MREIEGEREKRREREIEGERKTRNKSMSHLAESEVNLILTLA